MRKLKASDVREGQILILKKGKYKVLGVAVKAGKILITAETDGTKGRRTDTITYKPEAIVYIP